MGHCHECHFLMEDLGDNSLTGPPPLKPQIKPLRLRHLNSSHLALPRGPHQLVVALIPTELDPLFLGPPVSHLSPAPLAVDL